MNQSYQQRYDRLLYHKKTLTDNKAFLIKRIAELEANVALHKEASTLCAICIQKSIDVVEYVETLVTSLLEYVFGNVQFKFEVTKDKLGAISGLRPVIVEDGISEDADGTGDGVKNVAAFGLRLAFLLLNTELEPVLILDEPLTNLKADKWELLVEFLAEYTERLNVQIIIITHVDCEFPNTILVSKDKGISSVQVV